MDQVNSNKNVKIFSHILLFGFVCLFFFVVQGMNPMLCGGGGCSTAVLQRLAPNRSSQVSFEVLQYLWNFPYKLRQRCS